MCPGGTVVAAASEPGRVVTNGMSQYSRKERNANAGLVVEITPRADFPGHPLAGVDLQRHWEARAFAAGGETYAAPAQKLGDFLADRASTELGTVVPSYRPGVKPTDLTACLPHYAVFALREALPVFGRQIPGFDDPDAVLTGVETRTSSPIRITRGGDFQSLNTPGLYPAGEGAGYAGGNPFGGRRRDPKSRRPSRSRSARVMTEGWSGSARALRVHATRRQAKVAAPSIWNGDQRSLGSHDNPFWPGTPRRSGLILERRLR